MSEAINVYVKRVKELAEHVKGNEQATKQSLIGPLFTTLGYDMTDPRECKPEYKTDFGTARSVKPIDWAFYQGGRPTFFVEAKEVGKKLTGYTEQLGDYFAKSTDVKLGILTNGVQWRFFTDLNNSNVMDKEPFIQWDVLSDEEPPYDFLTLLQKSQYNPRLIRTFAEKKHAQNLLVAELSRLLEPSAEFVKLAVSNIETRSFTKSVLDFWNPLVVGALEQWVKERMLSMVLSGPSLNNVASNGLDVKPKIETTTEELDGFTTVQSLLGVERPVAYQDTVSYFKIHLPERRHWVVCRFYFDKKRPCVWVPLTLEQTNERIASFLSAKVSIPGWSCVTLESYADLETLGDLLRLAWDEQRQAHPEASVGEPEPEILGSQLAF